MKLTTTKDETLNKLSILVHGDSGCGKTTSIRTLPEKGTLVAIGERSAIPLRNHDFQVVHLETWDDVRNLLLAFKAPDECDNKPLGKLAKECRVLVIDSLSEVSEMCMEHILQVERRLLLKERSGGKSQSREKVYDDLMTLEDWGLYGKRMLNCISAFAHLPVHLIMTARSAWSKDRQGGDTLRTPGLSGKAGRECAAYVDIVLYMEPMEIEGKPSRRWRTFHDGRILAKDASGVLDAFEDTDWTALFTKVLNSKGGES